MLRSLPVKEPQQLVQVLAGIDEDVVEQPAVGAAARAAPVAVHRRVRLPTSGSTWRAAAKSSRQRASWPAAGSSRCSAFRRSSDAPSRPENDIRKDTASDNRQVAVLSYGFWQRHYRRRRRRARQAARARSGAVHHHRRHAARVHRRRSGHRLRHRHPAGRRVLMRGVNESAMDQRTWWWMRVMARLKPGDRSDGDHRAARRAAADARGHDPPTTTVRKNLANYLQRAVHPARGGQRHRRPRPPVPGSALLDHGGRGAGAAHRVREHRQPAARARQRAPARTERARCARRLALADRASAARGKRAALGVRHGARPAVRAVGRAAAGPEMSGETTAQALDIGLDWRVLSLHGRGRCRPQRSSSASSRPFARPAYRPNEAIKEQGRSIVGESRFGFGSMLVVAQVALSLVLIVGAGLFMRTFSTLSNVRLGFEPDPILIVSVGAKRSTVDVSERVRPLRAAAPGRRRGSRRAERRAADHHCR